MTTARSITGRSFERLRSTLWGLLPAAARRVIHPTMIGFAILNSCTFALDMLIVFVLGDVLKVSHGLTLFTAYTVALSAAFLLNRHFNFGAAGGRAGVQALRFLAVVGFNFVAFVYGATVLMQSLAASAGVTVPLVATRMVAGLLEAVFMYSALRWFVFVRSGLGSLTFRRRRTSLE